MYRDDYSRSQHSVEDDWTPPQTSDQEANTPPRLTKSSHMHAASDPGASNRFAAYAAYVNRFATLDPRMDYSDSMSSPNNSPYRPSQFEEKKEDPRLVQKRMIMQQRGDLHDYPDPDFGMEQMRAAEMDYHRGPPSMAGSAATTTILHSPGANRTRDLARRFEERSTQNNQPPPWHQQVAQHRGKERAASQPPPMHRHLHGRLEPPLQQHYRQKQTQSHDPPGTPPRLSPPEGQASHGLPQIDTNDYRARSEIETPAPARVSALKEKLWDETESLNVKIRPSPQNRPATNSLRSARSLSPKTSRRVYQHFGAKEETPAAPVQSAAPMHNPTHFDWTESCPEGRELPQNDHDRLSAYHRGRSGRSNSSATPRDDRSRSSFSREDGSARDDRFHSSTQREYRGREDRSHNSNGGERPYHSSRDESSHHTTPKEDLSYHGSREERSFSHYSAREDRSHHTGAEFGGGMNFEETGGELQNSTFFKSRFYEAAEKSTSSVGSGNRNVGMMRPAHGPPGSAVGATSYASTPRVSNHQENVAHLLAKLQSVNRSDPNAALREIDAILKAETGGSALESSRKSGLVPPSNKVAPEEISPGSPEGEDDDGDSETETTVSSITNPTFSGQGKHRKKKEEARKTHRPTLPTAVEGEESNYDSKRSQEAVERNSESRRKKVRSPPPDTIQVSAIRDRGSEKKGMEDGKRSSHALEKKLSAGLDATAELAEKIRRWDELSGKESAPEGKGPDLMSDTTDALGSIMTPSDLLPKKKPHHPWDASVSSRRGEVAIKDTSMDNGAGLEMQYSPIPTDKLRRRQDQWRRQDERNNPFAVDSDQESQQQESRASQDGSRMGGRPLQTVMSMSNEFDDAWVSMPASNFFSDTTPPRKTTPRKEASNDSPPPPPVSSKKASVQKFSPKRFESTQREMKYQPPSAEDRAKQTSASTKGAYDENRMDRVDEMPSEETEDDNIEVTLVGPKKEKRKGLRALLQRRNGKSQTLGGASSVISSGSRRRGQPHMAAYEAEIEPPRSASRGRRRGVSPSRARARSLEERRIRNPNIAKKFSRLLRVYNDEDRRPAEV